jgi:hypothetical protein
MVKRGRSENTNFVVKKLRCFLRVKRRRRRLNWEGGEKMRIKLMPNVYTALVCFLKITTVKNGIDAKNV